MILEWYCLFYNVIVIFDIVTVGVMMVFVELNCICGCDGGIFVY